MPRRNIVTANISLNDLCGKRASEWAMRPWKDSSLRALPALRQAYPSGGAEVLPPEGRPPDADCYGWAHSSR
jgi:hypothetical protein